MTKEAKNSVADLADQEKRTIEFNVPIIGHNFEIPWDLIGFIKQYSRTGFQASHLCMAIDEIRTMLGKQILFPEIAFTSNNKSIAEVENIRSKIFLGCTSNMVSSGLRENFMYLAKNKLIDVFVTTAGGIEEDIIKCLKPTFLASFDLDGKMLRKNGYNRIGNLVIPNENYCDFEIWLNRILNHIIDNHTELSRFFYFDCCDDDLTVKKPILQDLTILSDKSCPKSQEKGCKHIIMAPSTFIKILGLFINNDSSILYWCAKNDIPVYCPALTDGSIGDILTFFSRRNKIKLDIVKDIYNLNMESVGVDKTGVIILGSGVIKHAILNANLFRDGADHTVLLNNASEFDGSDAGANISEAQSWGKSTGKGVKVFGDASILFPLIAAAAFVYN